MMAVIRRPPWSVILKQPVVISRGGGLALGAQSDCKCGVRVVFGQSGQQGCVSFLVLLPGDRRWWHVGGAFCDTPSFRVRGPKARGVITILLLVAFFLLVDRGGTV